ncbi:hypothetical protein DFJ74DRAFT_717479 [Hyaloraphidium curvatum]|nr:hypothetical protein DFJ74DRAFT_717479 [Hyaloraphidium curvatum]
MHGDGKGGALDGSDAPQATSMVGPIFRVASCGRANRGIGSGNCLTGAAHRGGRIEGAAPPARLSKSCSPDAASIQGGASNPPPVQPPALLPGRPLPPLPPFHPLLPRPVNPRLHPRQPQQPLDPHPPGPRLPRGLEERPAGADQLLARLPRHALGDLQRGRGDAHVRPGGLHTRQREPVREPGPIGLPPLQAREQQLPALPGPPHHRKRLARRRPRIRAQHRCRNAPQRGVQEPRVLHHPRQLGNRRRRRPVRGYPHPLKHRPRLLRPAHPDQPVHGLVVVPRRHLPALPRNLGQPRPRVPAGRQHGTQVRAHRLRRHPPPARIHQPAPDPRGLAEPAGHHQRREHHGRGARVGGRVRRRRQAVQRAAGGVQLARAGGAVQQLRPDAGPRAHVEVGGEHVDGGRGEAREGAQEEGMQRGGEQRGVGEGGDRRCGVQHGEGLGGRRVRGEGRGGGERGEGGCGAEGQVRAEGGEGVRGRVDEVRGVVRGGVGGVGRAAGRPLAAVAELGPQVDPQVPRGRGADGVPLQLLARGGAGRRGRLHQDRQRVRGRLAAALVEQLRDGRVVAPLRERVRHGVHGARRGAQPQPREPAGERLAVRVRPQPGLRRPREQRADLVGQLDAGREGVLGHPPQPPRRLRHHRLALPRELVPAHADLPPGQLAPPPQRAAREPPGQPAQVRRAQGAQHGRVRRGARVHVPQAVLARACAALEAGERRGERRAGGRRRRRGAAWRRADGRAIAGHRGG